MKTSHPKPLFVSPERTRTRPAAFVAIAWGALVCLAPVAWGQAVQPLRDAGKRIEAKSAEKQQDEAKDSGDKDSGKKQRARQRDEKSAPPAAGKTGKADKAAPKQDADKAQKADGGDDAKKSAPAPAAAPDDDDAPAAGPPDIASLPTEDQMQVPSEDTLLKEPPVDWIVLKKDLRVVVTGMIFPRPDTLKKLEAAVEAEFKGKPLGEAGERERREEMLKVPVFLQSGGDEPLYRIHIKFIERIRYHEDLLLERIKLLVKEANAEPDKKSKKEKMSVAFEMLNDIQRRVPDWPGVADVQNDLLFYEALYRLENNEPEAALAYLEDLHAFKKDYPGLSAKLGEVADSLISVGFEANDFRRARYYLERLRATEKNHPVAVRWTQALADKALEVQKEAVAASEAGQHQQAAELIQRAASIWSGIPNMRQQFARMTNRYQTLNVGVLNLPDEPASCFLPNQSDSRKSYLTQPALFEIAGVRDTAVFRSNFFESWEPLDLGRRAQFVLRQSRQYWESQPIATAQEVVAALAARLDPGNPQYDQRFASYVQSLTVRSPFEFEIEFSRVPVSIESLLLAAPPLNRRPGAAQADVTDKPGAGDGALSGRFQIAERTDDRITYRRTIPEPDNAPEFHVAEIAEIKQRTPELAIQSLLRSEIDVLPHVPAWDFPRFLADGRFYVQKYAVPVSHVLQMNPRSKPLANREMRRALAYALDRVDLLRTVVLKDPRFDPASDTARARLITAPYGASSAAYDRLITMRDNDFALAYALAGAAKKQLKENMHKLRVLCVRDPVAQAAVGEIVKLWRLIGLEVELVPADGPTVSVESEDWDVVYRTVRIVEPAYQMWPFLTLQPYARVEDVQLLSDPVRLALVQLEDTNDWRASNVLLRKLQRHLWEDIQFIPLWEIDDYMVLRKTGVRGFSPEPVYTYDEIDRWNAISYFPAEGQGSQEAPTAAPTDQPATEQPANDQEPQAQP